MRTAKCPDCRAPVVWLANPFGASGWRPFEPSPVDGRRHVGAPAFPVTSRRAWCTGELIEELMAQRRWSSAEAEEEVYALPWYVRHRCAERAPGG